MLRLTKTSGETLLLSPPEVIAIERSGSVTIVRCRDHGIHVVVEMPEDVLTQIEAWRRGVESETPPSQVV